MKSGKIIKNIFHVYFTRIYIYRSVKGGQKGGVADSSAYPVNAPHVNLSLFFFPSIYPVEKKKKRERGRLLLSPRAIITDQTRTI